MDFKVCRKCKVEKQIDEFYLFYGKPTARCKKCRCGAASIYRKENPKKTRNAIERWRENNREKYIETARKWRKRNVELVRKKCRRAARKRCSTLHGRLNHNVSVGIGISLRWNKKGYHWEKLVGYTLKQLKQNLERKFTDGMTWKNYGQFGWHIDHIIPISAFNFEKSEDDDFKRCWDLKNLRPLWAFGNHSKGGRINKPFQMSLIFNHDAA